MPDADVLNNPCDNYKQREPTSFTYFVIYITKFIWRNISFKLVRGTCPTMLQNCCSNGVGLHVL